MFLSPVLVIFLIGSIISISMSLINKKFLEADEVKEVKKKIEEIRENMLKAQKKGNVKKVNEYLRELIKINSEYMRFMFKPIIFSVVVVLLILPFLNKAYSGQTIATIPKTLPFLGGLGLSWFWWYFISTIVISLILKKIFGV